MKPSILRNAWLLIVCLVPAFSWADSKPWGCTRAEQVCAEAGEQSHRCAAQKQLFASQCAEYWDQDSGATSVAPEVERSQAASEESDTRGRILERQKAQEEEERFTRACVSAVQACSSNRGSCGSYVDLLSQQGINCPQLGVQGDRGRGAETWPVVWNGQGREEVAQQAEAQQKEQALTARKADYLKLQIEGIQKDMNLAKAQMQRDHDRLQAYINSAQSTAMSQSQRSQVSADIRARRDAYTEQVKKYEWDQQQRQHELDDLMQQYKQTAASYAGGTYQPR